ncbi:MAG: LysM peptidoglycan-binding domain-containing protein [Chloroflexi bacterium]|nr:MAG: LysM peptidoglycan-binding domain-containing protein [Chloroflexota bacterium]MBL1194781.1 LysM peptidoglycan-binding domain-containing protein [Chloroflexota bacterium]NOH12073.1 phosphotransferase [Chloroflexota bacterium]
MKHRFLIALFIALLFGSAQASFAAPVSQEASEIISLINEYRAENDLAPLNINAQLTSAAQTQASYQASINTLTHNGAGGTSATDRAVAAGYGASGTPFISEIIYAGGNATPERALSWWKSSNIHNPIMLSLVRHEIGAAVATSNGQTYYTVVFGNIPGQTTALPLDADPGSLQTAVPTDDAVIAATPAPDGSILHLVQAGETLEDIAAAYGISVAELQALNNLQEGDDLPVALVIQEPLPLDQITPQVATATLVPPSATPSPVTVDIPTATPAGGAGGVDEGGSGSTSGETEASPPNQGVIFTTISLLIALLVSLVLNVWLFRSREQLLNELDPERQSRRRGVITRDAFAELSYDEQRERLEDLARVALEDYPLEVTNITPLQYQLNASFQVEGKPTDIEDGESQRFFLRISAPDYQSQDNIRSEMVYLKYIRDNSDLKVPNPLATHIGELMTTAESLQVPEPRNVIMLRWQEGGALPEDELGSTELEKVGAFMAKLHNLAEAFEEPDYFVRKRWDVDGLMGENLDVSVDRAHANLTAEQLVTINAALKRVEQAAHVLGESRDTFGLIHADLHQKNYIFENGVVRAIDFDTLGWGYYVYDIAVTFSRLLHRKDLGTLREAFLRGYRGERSLPPIHEQQIVPLVAARLVTTTLWLAGHAEDTIFKDVAPKQIDHQVQHLRAFLQR